ncbi:MAG: VanZ family protein [Planctomycetaceae bacterium]|nr:VanZ family protein [Planctomycetaceae bacterium]
MNWRQWGVVITSVIRMTFVCYAAALFTLTHIPIPASAAATVSSWDKAFHVGAYFGLAFLAMASFAWKPLSLNLVMPIVFALLVFAGLDEILQGPVGRTPDVVDWLADCFGVILGSASAGVVIHFVPVFRDWEALPNRPSDQCFPSPVDHSSP